MVRSSADDRPFLLDVSRLIWRLWRGRLPTGIDRVCLAYCRQFGPRAQAVVQWQGLRRVLPPEQSDALFALLASGSPAFRVKITLLMARATPRSQMIGKVYLNVGHTGLDAPGLSHWLARARSRPVFLIHDLIPITHPQFCRKGEASRHAQRMRQALETARGIIVNSAATQVALASFATSQNLTLPPIRMAWLGSDDADGRAPLPLAARPWFVVTGTIEARKNHLLLLHVWARLVATLGDTCPDLFIIGQRGWLADDVFALLDRAKTGDSKVHELGRCDDATRRALVAGARAVLMPSHIEGFGLPVIEALQCGVPVIASDLPVFREIAGDIPRYLDPHDLSAWVCAIREYTAECPDRARQCARIVHYSAPAWRDHFERIEPWLRNFA